MTCKIEIKNILFLMLLAGTQGHHLFNNIHPRTIKTDKPNILARLPTGVMPIFYNIKLTAHLEGDNTTFDGESHIEIKVNKQTDTLTLHANELIINNISLTSNKIQTSLSPMQHSINKTTDFLSIKFNKIIPIGNYMLYLNYTGIINHGTKGFYSHYNDNNETMFASTHFEPNGARMVFPCWDELYYKANFAIAIKHDKKFTARSNMPTYAIVNDNSTQQTTYFAVTPKISTYLIAFVLSNFSCQHNHDKNIELCSSKAITNTTAQYILVVTEKILKTLEIYTNISVKTNGLEKLTLISVPRFSFLISAMENWGLIIFREGILKNDDHDFYGKEMLTRTLIHEIVHQWFGNLVTPDWWDHIWLKEGFAGYLSYYIGDQIEPTWRYMDRFVVEKIQNSFSRDASTSISAMNLKLDNLDAIWSKHGSVVYHKSAAIIRMFSNIIGPNNFQIALRNYLNNHLYKVATPDDLSAELLKVTGTDFKSFTEVFNNWITTPGLPVVTVQRNYTTGIATLMQTRYLETANTTIAKEKYWIPINYVTANKIDFDNTTVTHWLRPNNQTLKLTGINNDDWLIINKQQFGYYRVNYDERNWELIIDALKANNYSGIHVLNRAQILNDAFNFAQTGQLNYSITLSLMNYLVNEIDYIAWYPVWKFIDHLNLKLRGTKYSESLKNYISKLTNKLTNDFTLDEMPNDYPMMALHRSEALECACVISSTSCSRAANKKVTQWAYSSDNYPIAKTLFKSILIFCAGGRTIDENVYAVLLNKSLINNAFDSMVALACTSNEKNLHKAFFEIINKNFDKISFFSSIVISDNNDDKGTTIVLNEIINNWKLITSQPGDNDATIGAIIRNISQTINNLEDVETFKAFIIKENDKIKQYYRNPEKLIEFAMTSFSKYTATLVEFEELLNY